MSVRVRVRVRPHVGVGGALDPVSDALYEYVGLGLGLGIGLGSDALYEYVLLAHVSHECLRRHAHLHSLGEEWCSAVHRTAKPGPDREEPCT